jgi:hypothetical protein
VKFTEESGGVAFSKTGGMESLGPPEGGIILAQPVGTLIQNEQTKNIARAEVINLMQDKLRAFVPYLSRAIVKVI